MYEIPIDSVEAIKLLIQQHSLITSEDESSSAARLMKFKL